MSESNEEAAEANNEVYQFLAVGKTQLRCFVFDVITTYTQSIPSIDVMNDICNFIETGEKPRGGLKAVK